MIMKRILFALALGVGCSASLSAEEPAQPAEPEKNGESSLIIDALRGLSALLPRPEAPPAENSQPSTIGIRGNESTTTLITPYWKGDRGEDPAFTAELSSYTAAQRLLQEQRWDEAQQAMTRFLTEFPKSDLTPNARFGQALATAGARHTGEAADQLRTFVRDYPEHPLRAEAEKLAAALTASQ